MHERAHKMRAWVLKDHPETAMSLNQMALCKEVSGTGCALSVANLA